MIAIEAKTGRKYKLVKIFVASGGTHLEAKTGRQYRLVKRYV